MSSSSKEKLLAAVKSILASGDHSDLIITCDGETFNTHKVVVCSQSDFFSKAVSFSVGKEAEDSKIDLPADDPAIIKLLVQFFYEAEYDPILPSIPSPKNGETYYTPQTHPHSCTDGLGCRNDESLRRICEHHRCGSDCSWVCANFVCSICLDPPSGSAEQVVTHARVYEIADKYGIKPLKVLVAEKFRRACWKWWNDTNFPIAVDIALNTTPDQDRGLHDTIQKAISMHIELLEKPEIEELLSAGNGLAFLLLKEKTSKK